MLTDSSTNNEPFLVPNVLALDMVDKTNGEYLSDLQEYNITQQLSAIDPRITNKMCQIVNITGSYKKPCNCTKSHCLKLYCECFARGSACENCNCSNCMNNEFHEEERRKAIKLTLERNPLAFHPKIGDGERKHSKGCNCKRSGCLKNYCECYEAKISCSDLCRCQGCRNFANGCDQKGVQELQSLGLSRGKGSIMQKKLNNYFSNTSIGACYQDSYVKLPHANQLFGKPQDLNIDVAQNYFIEEPLIPNGFLSLEVAEAACSCMLAQLDEAKQRSTSPSTQERIVLEEFGRCLEQILDSASKLQQSSVAQQDLTCAPYDVETNPDFITILPGSHELNLQTNPQVTGEVVQSTNYLTDVNATTQTMDSGPPSSYETKGMELMRYPDTIDPLSFGTQLNYVNQADKLSVTNSSDMAAHEMMNGVPFQIEHSVNPQVICPTMMRIIGENEGERLATDSNSTDQYFQFQPQLKMTTNETCAPANFHCDELYTNELNHPRITQLVTLQGILTQNTSSNIITNPGSVPIRHQSMNQDGGVLTDALGHFATYNNLKPDEKDEGEEEEEEANNATAALLNVSCSEESNRFVDLTESSFLSSSTDPFALRNLNMIDTVSPVERLDQHQPQVEPPSQHQPEPLSLSMQTEQQQSLINTPAAQPPPFQTHLLSESENYDPLAYAGQLSGENPGFLKTEIDFFDF